MFHIKMCKFLGNFSRYTLINIYTRRHQTALHFPNFLGEQAYALAYDAYACNYNLYAFLHENSHFLFKIISKFTQNVSIVKVFKKFHYENYPIATCI